MICVVKNGYTAVCPRVREIIHSLKLVDFLLVQADKPWHNYITISVQENRAKGYLKTCANSEGSEHSFSQY